MTWLSLPWANNGVGDGQTYDDDEWSDWQRDAFTADPTTQGPIVGCLNELAVTNPSGYTLRVATGAAWVDGKFVRNTANTDFTTTDSGAAITAPGGGTNYYTLVLRKTWATQLVRPAVLDVSTVAYPVPTQSDGVVWEIALAHFAVTSAGAKTLTSVQQFANNNGAPRLAGRQSTDATDWSRTSGGYGALANFFPKTNFSMQCGAVPDDTNASSGIVTVTFPVAFSALPLAFVVPAYDNSIGSDIAVIQIVASKTTLQIYWKTTNAGVNRTFNWLAIGPT